MVDKEFDAWLAPFSSPRVGRHALLGPAFVGSDSVSLEMHVPESFVAFRSRFPGVQPLAGPIRPLPKGAYAVWVGGVRLAGVVVDVAVAGRPRIPDVSHVVVDPARALLRDSGLGNVAFGTGVVPALRALEALFGPPLADTGRIDGCWPAAGSGGAGALDRVSRVER